MPSAPKALFDTQIAECREAIATYDYLEKISKYRADFSLRFVWIAAVSALDHYISQVIVEKSSDLFSNKKDLSLRIMAEMTPLSSAIELNRANDVDSVLIFKKVVSNFVRYRSFQYPDKVADGLSFVWDEKHKWQSIATAMGSSIEHVKGTLENIVDRRNLIAHNADYDEAIRGRLQVTLPNAVEVVDFMHRLVTEIDRKLYPSKE